MELAVAQIFVCAGHRMLRGPEFLLEPSGFRRRSTRRSRDQDRFDFGDTDFEGGFNFIAGARSRGGTFFELKDHGVRRYHRAADGRVQFLSGCGRGGHARGRAIISVRVTRWVRDRAPLLVWAASSIGRAADS